MYVMGKSVMPLFVTGNFALSVGRRLNADGTVTNVGQVAGVYDYQKDPQRGLSLDNTIVTRWVPTADRWEVVAKPTGIPLQQ